MTSEAGQVRAQPGGRWDQEGIGAGANRVSQASIGNALLRALPAHDFALLQPHLHRVALPLGSTLAVAGERIEALSFPEASVVALLEILEGDRKLAIALTGREGVVGWPLLLGNDRWPLHAIVRAENGTALRIAAGDFANVTRQHPNIGLAILRYGNCVAAQMARTIASNLIHSVERRTARWLLLYHDRIDGDEITITHEELGIMLGVRRSSITDALHQLEGAGAIRGLRGRVVIRDRHYLEGLAGETYGFPETEYRRLISSRD